MIRQNKNSLVVSVIEKSVEETMMRGIKRKIPLERIEKKESRAVAFTKRSKGLYSKASDLCLLSGGQIAIIATPVSSNSNVSFYSFGHSSVDSVVSAFLANQHPREDDDQGLGFWWNDEGLARSENPEELREAMNSMSKLLQNLKDLEKRFGDVEKNSLLHETHQNQTLDFQSSSAKQELSLDEIFDIVDSQGPPGNNEELNLDDMSDFEAFVYGGSTKDEDMETKSVLHETHQNQIIHLQSSSTSANFDKKSEDQTLAMSDKNNNNSDWFDQELNLDDMSGFEAFVYGGSTKDEDDLHFSDFFNELASITAL